MNRGAVLTAVAAAILVWGYAFVPLKHLTSPQYTDHPLSPEAFLVLRFVPLLPLLLLVAARYARRERSQALRRDWPWILAMGVLVIPAYHVPFNYAIRTPLHTGLMSLILNLSPALTYFLAVGFGQEKARRARTTGVVIAFAGLAVIVGEEIVRDPEAASGEVFSWEGAGLMLLCAVSWTAYTLIGRRIAADHNPQFLFAVSGVAGTLVVLALAPSYLKGDAFAQYSRLAALDWAAWAYASLLSSFFAYWAWLLALTRYEASRLSSAANLVPLLVHAAAAVFLPEERKAFTPLYLAGAALTVTGTVLVVRRGVTDETRPPR